MKKIRILLCLAILLTGCSSLGSSDADYMKYADSSEEVAAVAGTIVDTAVKKPQETTTAETMPPEPEKPKLTDEELNALENTEKGYGQGKQVDDKNRPLGALDFNNQYSQYDAYALNENAGKEIYLTFDQGYENGFTAAILDTLKEKDAKAVFFLTGDYVRSQPELVQRMIDEGHVLGNHGNKHKSLPLCSIEDAEKELQDCYNLVKEKFGYDMKLERPPCGTFSEKSLAITQRLGYKTVLWSFAYKDWEVNNQPNPDDAYERITSCAHDGAIYLLHSVSETNCNILGKVIDNFKSQGYTLTTPNL